MHVIVVTGQLGISIEDDGPGDREVVATRAASSLRSTIEAEGWSRSHFEVRFPDGESFGLDAMPNGWLLEDRTMLTPKDIGAYP